VEEGGEKEEEVEGGRAVRRGGRSVETGGMFSSVDVTLSSLGDDVAADLYDVTLLYLSVTSLLLLLLLRVEGWSRE
jgi:hypothetical protein